MLEFDSRVGVNRLHPYPRLAHASFSLRKATILKSGSARPYLQTASVSRVLRAQVTLRA